MYRIEFKNHSKMQVAFFLYIKPPETPPHTISVCCFRRLCHPEVSVDFSWEENLCFVWGENRTLSPGPVVCAVLPDKKNCSSRGFYYSEIKPLQDWGKNKIGISLQNDSFIFTDSDLEVEHGKLGIASDHTVVEEKISAGIGFLDENNETVCGSIINKMGPNQHYIYEPPLHYMVTFSQDLNKPDTANAQELNFQNGQNLAQATLDESNLLHLTYSTEL